MSPSASNAAAFMHLLKEACNLVLSISELVKISTSIKCETPFFIYNYSSANISGSAETMKSIEPLDEEAFD